ncbi:hypothetical protein [Streptomyces aurantiacus]
MVDGLVGAGARKLRDALKTERADGRPLHSVDDPEGETPTAEAA